MLYVSEDDETVWEAAKRLGARTDASMSKLVTLALSEYVAAHPGALRGGVVVDRDVAVRRIRNADAPLTHRLRQLLKEFGRDRVALAYANACYAEGAGERPPGRQPIEGTVDAADKPARGQPSSPARARKTKPARTN